jgi:hypothetical protein
VRRATRASALTRPLLHAPLRGFRQPSLPTLTARWAQKQSLEKSALTTTRVAGELLRGGALLLLFFYLKTGANKLVDLIASLKVALGEFPINVVARIGVPNEPRDFYEKLLFLLSLGLLVSRSVNAARRTRASFERSSLYTCDFDSAPCLTMMVSPGGDL